MAGRSRRRLSEEARVSAWEQIEARRELMVGARKAMDASELAALGHAVHIAYNKSLLGEPIHQHDREAKVYDAAQRAARKQHIEPHYATTRAFLRINYSVAVQMASLDAFARGAHPEEIIQTSFDPRVITRINESRAV